jgi:hypothetical protein
VVRLPIALLCPRNPKWPSITETSAPGKPRPASRRVAVERLSSRMASRCGRWTRVRAEARTLPQFPIARRRPAAVAEAPQPSRRRRRLSRGRESFPACKALKTHKTRKFASSPPSGEKVDFAARFQFNSDAAGSSSANDAGDILAKHGATDRMRNFPACNALKTHEMLKFSSSSPRRSAPSRRSSPRLIIDSSNRDFRSAGSQRESRVGNRAVTA